jgi:3-dehydroquinate synthase
MGIAVDSLYSFHLGLINEMELHKIMTILQDIGFELYHWALRWMDIPKAMREFQEHMGGALTIILLNGIGNRVEVHQVDTEIYRKCIDTLVMRSLERGRQDGYRKEPDVSKRGVRYLLP